MHITQTSEDHCLHRHFDTFKERRRIRSGLVMLFADCDPLLNGAVLTDDIAAPVEAAVAAVGSSLLDDVVSATAAQGATAVDAGARAVALPPSRAGEVHTGVSLAEVG
jgi:hypothetical protein